VSKVGGLKRTTEVVSIARAAIPAARANRPAAPSTKRSPSSAASPTIPSSKSGRTRSWRFQAGLGAETSLKDFRKDIIIEMYNEAGQLALSYKCSAAGFRVPGIARSRRQRRAVAIRHIKLENEGMGARCRVTEPTEPSFAVPT
jgi:hypothetical protein